MKPRNFPERRRQRQAVALALFGLPGTATPIRNDERPKATAERLTLERAVSRGSRRDVRTKKDRTANAGLLRRAK